MRLVQSKFLKKALSLILAFAFVFSCSTSVITVNATSTSTLNSKKEKIKDRIDDAEKKISQLKSEKKKTQELVAALDEKIQLLKDEISVLKSEANDLQKNIDKVQAQINEAEQKIVEIQAEIDRKQAEFDQTFDAYCKRLRAIYISGSASNLEILLTSSDLSSILTRSQMIKSVSEKDSDALQFLMDKMDEIEKGKAELEQTRLKLQEDKKSLVADKKKLTDNINSVSAKKATLDAQVAEANALMKELDSQTAEYQESIEDNEDELAAIEAEIRRAQAQSSMSGSTGNGAHSGALGYPTNSRAISAGYPNYSGGGYHGGIDFRVASGSPVYAAASGTVIISTDLVDSRGNYRSYGRYIVIDHGNGLSTLYAHNSTRLVSVGTHVTKGQLIAKSGSTGNSTGPHCHFEVRINGTRVNPLNYL